MTDQQTPHFVARRAFGYAGVDLARGQIFTLVGSLNDARLEELRYIMPLAPGTETFTCPDCGAGFLVAMVSPEGHRATHRRSSPPTAAQER